ncbi:MAG: hypothetical protein SAK29_02785 [Scytonema sp. PMC 1069.18]|nr:hypothetical protein [Scytonema sp. PMC 1069.18]MEC4885624.1 hypothetical protein [Scytonema sp. PMC 1070.18]
MTINQPSIEERLSRLETLFVNVGEKVAEHDGNIDVLVANIQQLTENVNTLAEQAATDRQELRNSVNQILNYLRDRNGGSPPPQI